MATRLEILEAFYSELISAVDGLVPADDVSLISGETLEESPSVVYDKNYRIRNFNRAGTAPDLIVRDSNGVVQKEVFYDYTEAQYFIYIRADSQSELEPIYDAIYKHFQKWKFPRLANINSFHPDVVDPIEIREINSADDPSAEATFRGDAIELVILFKEDFDSVKDVIETVELDKDDTIYITN